MQYLPVILFYAGNPGCGKPVQTQVLSPFIKRFFLHFFHNKSISQADVSFFSAFFGLSRGAGFPAAWFSYYMHIYNTFLHFIVS
ncbi:hypothetical protein DXA13_15430 [Clostridium sp. AM58-1XD]|nr:hypothetical protein DXA13_15430 [Clostridium sp. AM58-1XD]